MLFCRVPHMRAASAGSESKLSYTPQNTMDYGTLLCSASNTVGEQREPCVFHIIMAGWCCTLYLFPFSSIEPAIYIYWVMSNSFLQSTERSWEIWGSFMVFNFKSLVIQRNFLDPIYFLVKKMNVWKDLIRKVEGKHFLYTMPICVMSHH